MFIVHKLPCKVLRNSSQMFEQLEFQTNCIELIEKKKHEKTL